MNIPKKRLIFATLAWHSAATDAAAAESAVLQSVVLIENVRIFDGQSPRLSGPSYVLVVGNSIQSISTRPISPPAGARVTRIAGGGRTLMPGLIDNHVHIALSTTGQADLLEPRNHDGRAAGAGHQGGGRMLLRGFTAVRDMGGPLLDRAAADRQRRVARPAHLPERRDDLADLRPWRLAPAARALPPLLRRGVEGRAAGRQFHRRRA